MNRSNNPYSSDFGLANPRWGVPRLRPLNNRCDSAQFWIRVGGYMLETRLRLKLTQAALAWEWGTQSETISGWERARIRPTAANLAKILLWIHAHAEPGERSVLESPPAPAAPSPAWSEQNL